MGEPLSFDLHDRADCPPPQEVAWASGPGFAGKRADFRPAQAKSRHGIVNRIIMPPYFRPASAVLHCYNQNLRWPDPFGSGFLSPQPPGIVGVGPVRATALDSHRANESWSFFLSMPFRENAVIRATAQRRIMIFTGDAQALAIAPFNAAW
jgi:hypothetical protein